MSDREKKGGKDERKKFGKQWGREETIESVSADRERQEVMSASKAPDVYFHISG